MLARIRNALTLSTRGNVTQMGSQGWSIVQGLGPGAYQHSGRTARMKGFEQNPVAHACVRIVTDLVGSVPLQAYTKNAHGDAQPVKAEHPLAMLLDAPGMGVNAGRHRKLTIAQFLNYGNAYWHLERASKHGLPTALRIVHPERVQYMYRDRASEAPVAYQWTDTFGARHDSPAFDLLHWRDLTVAEDASFGFPRVVAALLDLVTDDEASQYVRQVLSNHGAPGIAVMLDGMIDADSARSLEERWQEKFVNRGGRGRAAFLGGATKLEKIGFDLKELEFPALRAIAREDICAVFGVDPRMVGVASASGKEGGMSGVQFQEARMRLYLQTGAPLMLDFTNEINDALAPEFGPDVYVRFDPDRLSDITENMEQTSARAVKELLAGGITVEEFRDITGRDPDMKPEHHVLIPGTSALRTVQEAQADAAKPTPEPADPVELAAAVAKAKASGGAPPGGDASPPKPAADAKRAVVARLVTRVIRPGDVLTEAEKVTLWERFDARATHGEAPYVAAALAQLEEERQAVAAAFAHAQGRSTQADGDPEPTDDHALDGVLRWLGVYYAGNITSEAVKGWVARFRRVIGHSVEQAGKEVAVQVGVSFDLENPRVQDAITRRVTKLAGNVTETTAEEIRGLIAAGRAAGLSVSDIAATIDQAVFAGRNRARAELIARTEIVGALNEGEYLAAQATNGAVTTKAWLSKRDPKVRDAHEACDAEGDIPLSALFSNGLLYPGDANGSAEEVCNCRCTLVFGAMDVPRQAPSPVVNLALTVEGPKGGTRRVSMTRPNGEVVTADITEGT